MGAKRFHGVCLLLGGYGDCRAPVLYVRSGSGVLDIGGEVHGPSNIVPYGGWQGKQ
ncbi:hypothetical protein QJS10_CPB15g01394 [Acorus calamus]|uniref:Uncharacterized protein n=1 Tax=Acorus calamus TaxID=4465 RepID=A0AAV9DA10_ACOCL|nr:hypothetical protein QJS10_CPB15g01394 [Acorus calamus]